MESPLPNIYAPYREDAEAQHRYSLRHRHSVVAHPRYADPFELDVEDLQITFDSAWSPYIQGSITAKAGDEASLAALDPRAGCRVHVFAGYVYDGMVDDVHLLADLHVRERKVNRPDNTVTLTVSSDEALAEDYKRLAWGPHASTSGMTPFVQFHADRASIPDTATVRSDYGYDLGADDIAGMVQDVGQDSLSMLQDAAERVGVRVYVDGDRTWRIAPLPEYSGATALKLFTGPEGTILDAAATLTRGAVDGHGFHNAVSIKYLWKDSGGVDRVNFGNAVVASGPYAPSAIGYNVLYLERPYAVASTAKANQAAANVLKPLVGRGHQVELGAHAAYWLRPGHTVTVQLPAGGQERHLVRSVSFHPLTGRMDLGLVQPINVTISTSSG
ncbi:minor tail protein [Arthrobacter phage BlueFeather]|uniref:Minor tail protein n=1 Tax=Arthrobacter phage BlueFeather TaxID=2713258 RepID=A0A6G8R2B0_9CAUD|nr:minor tail protein [Arthrobacter phage BlueFeather]QIN94316.1 minor tail protein [Arthrobacter phage BlueFeather]